MKKNKINYINLLLLGTLLVSAGCKKDNYDSPDASLYGKVLDAATGEIVPGSVSKGQYGRLFLYQLDYGSANPNAIVSEFNADGTYENAFIFSGKYKVVPREGPWEYTDTLIADVNGRTEKDIKVKPWFTSTITVGTVTATSVTVSVTCKNNFPVSAANKTARVAAVLDINQQGLNINDYAQRLLTNVEGVSNDIVNTTTYTYNFTGLTPATTYYIRGAGRRSTPAYYAYSKTIIVKTAN